MLESDPKAIAVTRWGQRCLAILFVALVVGVYWTSLSNGRWPVGHPWSGLFFLTFAAGFWARSFAPSSRPVWPPTVPGVVAVVLFALSFVWSILWYMNAIGR